MESVLGQIVSGYRVIACLGESEEAYRAEDTRSGRLVSLRFLPDESTRDLQGLSRFQQSARALAALEHRHVAGVYDLGAWEGHPFLVTEFLDGETLRQHLGGRPLGFPELLDLGVQIADALSAAHAAGVVHGGLQPASILISRQGGAKVADFGLAGLSAGKAAASAYQAPEQLRGEPADERSDLFSLGAILQEMATGQPAFSGADAAAIREAILEQEAAPPSQANPELPGRFDEIVAKALEKNRELRYQIAAELLVDLRRLRRDWDSERVAAARAALTEGRLAQAGPAGESTSAAGDAAVLARRRRVKAVGIAAALLLAAALGGVAVRLLQPPVRRLPNVFHPLTFGEGRIDSARFGVHGQEVFYTARWNGAPPRIFTLTPDSPEPVPLRLDDARLLSVSPANELAILADVHPEGEGVEGNLENVALAGGSGQPVLKNVESADWAPGGRGIAVVRRVGGMDRLEYPVGKVLEQTRGWIGDPRFSPASDRIAFVEHPAPGSDAGSVDVVNLAGQKKVLSPDWASVRGLAWSPEGDEVWFTAARRGGRQLYAVTLAGQSRQIAAVAGSLRLEDVARDGRALLLREDSRAQMAEVTRGQTGEQDISWLSGSELGDVSADGKTILFNEAGPAGGTEDSIYVRETSGAAPRRLGAGRALGLSPDGKWVLAETFGPRSHLVALPVGAGKRVDLPAAAVSPVWAAWLPDDKQFVFLGRQPGQGLQLFVQEVAGGPPRAISPAGLGSSAALSSDGRRVAAIGPDGKGYLYPVGGGEVTEFRGLAAEDRLVGWDRYGYAIYVAEGALPVKIFRVSLATGAKTPLFQLAPADPTGVVRLGTIRVTPDGRFFFFSYKRTLSRLYLAEGLR